MLSEAKWTHVILATEFLGLGSLITEEHGLCYWSKVTQESKYKPPKEYLPVKSFSKYFHKTGKYFQHLFMITMTRNTVHYMSRDRFPAGPDNI